MISKIVIFTDLDGTLLHNETFKFENIKQYIKNLFQIGQVFFVIYVKNK